MIIICVQDAPNLVREYEKSNHNHLLGNFAVNYRIKLKSRKRLLLFIT